MIHDVEETQLQFRFPFSPHWHRPLGDSIVLQHSKKVLVIVKQGVNITLL